MSPSELHRAISNALKGAVELLERVTSPQRNNERRSDSDGPRVTDSANTQITTIQADSECKSKICQSPVAMQVAHQTQRKANSQVTTILKGSAADSDGPRVTDSANTQITTIQADSASKSKICQSPVAMQVAHQTQRKANSQVTTILTGSAALSKDPTVTDSANTQTNTIKMDSASGSEICQCPVAVQHNIQPDEANSQVKAAQPPAGKKETPTEKVRKPN